jgi:pyrimidine operon attenuation protein/uracil phosphoribosyltransferase
MEPRIILNSRQFSLTLNRLSYQLIEVHGDFSGSCLIGIQPRGVNLTNRLSGMLQNILNREIETGRLDISFYRDDFKSRPQLKVEDTNIRFTIEGKRVILADDVLYTGRTVRAAMDALLDFGRPSKVELLVLIDRRFSRQFPIQPDYTGKAIDSIYSEQVKVQWKEHDKKDAVWILKEEFEPANSGQR